jgi:hypothetical protein
MRQINFKTNQIVGRSAPQRFGRNGVGVGILNHDPCVSFSSMGQSLSLPTICVGIVLLMVSSINMGGEIVKMWGTIFVVAGLIFLFLSLLLVICLHKAECTLDYVWTFFDTVIVGYTAIVVIRLVMILDPVSAHSQWIHIMCHSIIFGGAIPLLMPVLFVLAFYCCSWSQHSIKFNCKLSIRLFLLSFLVMCAGLILLTLTLIKVDVGMELWMILALSTF